MDIIEVFSKTLKNIEMKWVYHKKLLLKNPDCIEHI